MYNYKHLVVLNDCKLCLITKSLCDKVGWVRWAAYYWFHVMNNAAYSKNILYFSCKRINFERKPHKNFNTGNLHYVKLYYGM